jgi:hypothetical protein
LPDFDVTRIQWEEERCIVKSGKSRKRVIFGPSAGGGSFHIQLPRGFLENMEDGQTMELSLKDVRGNRWTVRPFFPSENMVPLFFSEPEEKIIADYGDSDR